MQMLTLILTLSMIMWYCVDRFKELWSKLSWGKYITILVSAALAMGLSFSFSLDIVFALGLVNTASIAGKILTGLILMSGSSAVSEIISFCKGVSTKNGN